MEAGKRDERIRFERKAITQDATFGTDVVQWAEVAEVWAEWQDALPSRSESVRQGLEVARDQSRVRACYNADIDSSMRIFRFKNSLYYQIVGGPAELGRKDGIELVVERYSS